MDKILLEKGLKSPAPEPSKLYNSAMKKLFAVQKRGQISTSTHLHHSGPANAGRQQLSLCDRERQFKRPHHLYAVVSS